MQRILIVEDEEKLARYLELELTHEGYEVEKAGNGLDAVEAVSRTFSAVSGSSGQQPGFDLVLLDVMLPGINGMEVLRRIRQMAEDKTQDGTIIHAPPVILLTARDQVMDKVAGLDAGAVDYITKPFAIEELLARIRVALKLHAQSSAVVSTALPSHGDAVADTGASVMSPNGQGVHSPEEGILRWRGLVLDEKKHRVTYDGTEITLTNREFLMLKTLLVNRDIVLSRDVLLSKVCGYDYVGETNVIDVYVRYLRTKIDEVFGVRMIQTVRGVGYVIYDDEA